MSLRSIDRLSSADVSHGSDLRRLGYRVLERFLDEEAVRSTSRGVDAALDGPAMLGCQRPNNRLAALRWDHPVVRVVLDDRDRMAGLKRAAEARDLRWISAYVSSKEPFSPPLPWHQDWWCWDHPISFQPAAAQLALLCYLGPTDSNNGALRLLPSSHRQSTPLHRELYDARAAASPEGDYPLLCEKLGQVTLSLNPGDAVLLDYRLLHGTHANESSERRDCVLLSFAPSWSALPAELKAHLIQHPALPSEGEQATARSSFMAPVLPQFDGCRADLPLNVTGPAEFTTH